MRRIAVAVLALLGLVVAAPAQADGQTPPPRLASTVMCIRADFPVLGSGWKIQAAAAAWNAEQPIIRMTFTPTPGCADVIVHRYISTTDGRCGYTTWDRQWGQSVVTESGDRLAVGADIYLNDACVTAGTQYTRRTVAHELGHAMGLPHSESPRSVMCECAHYPLLRQRLIGPVDVRDLRAIYAPQ